LAWILNDAKGFQVNTLGEFLCLVKVSSDSQTLQQSSVDKLFEILSILFYS